jgi:HAD superfamily hydrolase (TIGR01549 family)
MGATGDRATGELVAAVTLDLWHTLIYLPPDAEERYMHAQVRIAGEALSRAPVRSGGRTLPISELRHAFEVVYQAAVDASGEGRTVTPTEQFRIAAERTDRLARPEDYLVGLKEEVEAMRFEAAPGVIEFLAGLRQDGYRVAVISNTVGEPGRYLRPILTRMGFDPFVEAYVFSDELPWTKPNPEIFRAALGKIGSTPAEAIHVGDGWSDIEGAKRTGYRTGILFTGLHEYGARYKEMFLAHGWDQPPADHRASRLDEVARIVRAVLPAPSP